MERLTKSGVVSQRDINRLLELSDENRSGRNDAYYKLKEYEDLEEALENVYGDCPDLLKTVVNTLVTRSDQVNTVLGEKPIKARLLTDEDADKWTEYKQLDEQGKLLKLPCKVRDIVYVILSHSNVTYAEAEVKDFIYFTSCGFCIVVTSNSFDKQNIPFTEFGKTVFLTKSEAEEKLRELGGEDNETC